jgi:hypothetical protein
MTKNSYWFIDFMIIILLFSLFLSPIYSSKQSIYFCQAHAYVSWTNQSSIAANYCLWWIGSVDSRQIYCTMLDDFMTKSCNICEKLCSDICIWYNLQMMIQNLSWHNYIHMNICSIDLQHWFDPYISTIIWQCFHSDYCPSK